MHGVAPPIAAITELEMVGAFEPMFPTTIADKGLACIGVVGEFSWQTDSFRLYMRCARCGVSRVGSLYNPYILPTSSLAAPATPLRLLGETCVILREDFDEVNSAIPHLVLQLFLPCFFFSYCYGCHCYRTCYCYCYPHCDCY